VTVSKPAPSKFVAPPNPFQRATGSMNSTPAASSIRASATLSSHDADQRSLTFVAAIPEDMFAPKMPSLSAFGL